FLSLESCIRLLSCSRRVVALVATIGKQQEREQCDVAIFVIAITPFATSCGRHHAYPRPSHMTPCARLPSRAIQSPARPSEPIAGGFAESRPARYSETLHVPAHGRCTSRKRSPARFLRRRTPESPQSARPDRIAPVQGNASANEW